MEVHDKFSKIAVKKYNLPENWGWTLASRNGVEGGILLTGRCESIYEDESQKHLSKKTYFISDEEIKNFKEGEL